MDADGQTGSGKTHTMTGIQRSVADDLFYLLNSERERGSAVHEDLRVFVAFFEIYGGRCQVTCRCRHMNRTAGAAKRLGSELLMYYNMFFY